MIIIRLKGDIGMDVDIDVKRLLGNRIKELRRLRKMTQEQLAERIGIEPNNVSKIEVGKNYPSPENLAKIARALEIEIHELFIFNHLKPIEDIRESVINEVQRSDRLARLLFKFCQVVNQP